MKSLFLLDPEIIFLNHGSFGACPRLVFEAYQGWQNRLEQQPVLFLGRQMRELDQMARLALGAYVNAPADDLVFVTNVTQAVNIVARSIGLAPGDEILSTNHEYGACDYTWEFICKKTGARYIRHPIPLPITNLEDIVEGFWQTVTPRTKIIYLSHITSPTAIQLPIEEICIRARRQGILTVIDGAHAPGQIPLDLRVIPADFYAGNCHKWMMAPKGAGFLYARPEVQHLIEPLIVSWGYHATPETTNGSQFLDYLSWTGTKDPAAVLSVPTAIQFMQKYNWDQVGKHCHALLHQTIQRICEIVELDPPYPLESKLYQQMGIAPLPPETNIAALKDRLYDKHHIEVPLIDWNGKKFVRISVQGYNTPDDLDVLCDAIRREG